MIFLNHLTIHYFTYDVRNNVILYSMLKESVIEGIKNTFSFKGSMLRQQFWCYWLVMIVAIYIIPQILSFFGLAVFTGMKENPHVPLYVVYGSMLMGYLLYLMTMSAKVRRLHDIGWSGWWVAAEYLLSAVLLFYSTRMMIAFAIGGLSYLFERYMILAIGFLIYIVLKIFLVVLYLQEGE